METEIKILEFMLNKKEPLTINALAKSIKKDYKIVHTAVQKLTLKGILSEKKVGMACVLEINQKSSIEIFEAEYRRRENLIRNKNLRILYETLLKQPFQFIALIFGSYARGEQTKKSDIDLMIISSENRMSQLKSALNLLPLDIHLIFFDYKEFMQMKNSKEFSVVSEAVKSNVIIINIEEYYRLLNNVR